MGGLVIEIPDDVLQEIRTLEALQSGRVYGVNHRRVLKMVDDSTMMSKRIGDILITIIVIQDKKRRLLK